MKPAFKPNHQSGNKVVDDFLRTTLEDRPRKMEYVPYNRFEDIRLIAEGGFSKIYNTKWIDGPISDWDDERKVYNRFGAMTVVLKELSNSKKVTFKDLNELNIFHNLVSLNRNYVSRDESNNNGNHNHNDSYCKYINKYYGITQDPVTQNFMIVMEYHNLGDLTHYIARNFFNISWYSKINILQNIIYGLKNIHHANILHKDYHSGNIFLDKNTYHENVFTNNIENIEAITGDLGLSTIEQSDNDDSNEVYGIIPYIAPEIFKGQKYTKASDIYSLGMIMWELMTGRKPFWDQDHDTDLIIEICDGFRPPIVTNAPEGYIKLMKRCWRSHPNERPKTADIYKEIEIIRTNESGNVSTEVIKSSDIGPIPINNNSGEIYKSRSLSAMIKYAEYLKSLRIQSSFMKSNKPSKKIKLFEYYDGGYLTIEFELDIDINV
ncbi:kinase-like domain-containing protein [Rhizophagus clarus]|uniref:Kinase-like domain-containing protein n=1 Tax=Rhizophagus clarus TaxID=94130 RepID=A0A8H3QVK1_9GLOM|nr:kinase-like domain-containing protein [Rhizophagus clarus]